MLGGAVWKDEMASFAFTWVEDVGEGKGRNV